MTVIHPIEPIYNENSQILILGSFPSVKSREEMFYYAHPQNRFWKVVSAVYQCELPKNVDEKRAFLLDNRIALWDVIASCEVNGSSDVSIKNAIPNDLTQIMTAARIKSILLNGKTAEKYYNKYQKKIVSTDAVLLPSTSPANASYSTERLIKEWKEVILK